MATSLTRFEIVVPNVDTGSPADTAIQQFLTSMRTLCKLVQYTAYIYPQGAGDMIQQNCIYGLITAAQQSTALGYLNTLNAALGSPMPCTVSQVTSQP